MNGGGSALILICHPTGNTFVRALLLGLSESDELDSFHTTLFSGHLPGWLPPELKENLLRRAYPINPSKIRCYPLREAVRLLAARVGFTSLTVHERGWASMDAVCRALDSAVAEHLRLRSKHQSPIPSGVYCYEDTSLQTFKIAKILGIKCFYDLPIAYWETSQKLLKEESARLPEWEPTLTGTQDSASKLERKSEEINLADVVICPSKFVLNSLPLHILNERKCIVAEFGTPEGFSTESSVRRDARTPLRLLFAGSLSQRKGLADVFAAMKLLN